MSLTLKIAVIGPKGVGKSTICNGLCDFSTQVTSEYRPTKGVRILEKDQDLNDEALKVHKDIKKSNIQLWDLGGDKMNEKFWPSVKSELNGVILIIDGKNQKYENALDEWINSFCLPDIDIDNTICICYNKDNSKPDKQKSSNQFPKLVIYETGYDIHNLMPILHQFVDKLILKVKV